MYILLAMPDAGAYKRDLETRFPGLSFFAATSQEEMRGHMGKAEVIITIFRIADDLLRKAAHLQWVQVTTSGVNYLLSRPSLGKGVIVTTCRGIHGPQVSEMAFLLMLALNRNFPEVVRNQDRRVWERWPGILLHRKKAGIVGLGVIGEEIARKCKAFGMTVFGVDAVHRELDAVDFFSGPETLPEVAGKVDYLILVVPSTPQTVKMVGPRVLERMKPTSFLINLARGEVVDEEALMEALENRRIAGAALDALTTEPLPPDHPLWRAKNVIITPHVGGESDTYREQVMPIVEDNLRRFLGGERRSLINLVER